MKIVGELLKHPKQFTYFQAMRLLRRHLAGDEFDNPDDAIEYRVRVRPNLSLAFPATDLTDVSQLDDDKGHEHFTVTANMLGLYGADAPLPTFYTEDLIEEARDDESASRDFIDIVNASLYYLLYRCFTKYRVPIKVGEERDKLVFEILFSLVGLGIPKLREALNHPEKLLRYGGLLSQYPRSALGLRTLLADGIQEPTLDVEPCQPRWAPIPSDQRCHLGEQGSRLGEDAYLGQFIYERMGKLELKIGPVDADRLHALLPGRADHDEAVFLTRFYLLEPLLVDMEVRLAPGEAEQACLGGARWGNLGWNTWVFSGEFHEETRACFRI